jgi:hypothetical protein
LNVTGEKPNTTLRAPTAPATSATRSAVVPVKKATGWS